MLSSADDITLLIREAEEAPSYNKFTTMTTANRDTLHKLISRQVRLILRRSADLSLNRVTIFDKALLHLTRDGDDPTYPPAIRLFCKEFLGIDDDEDSNVAKAILDQFSFLPSPFDQASTVVCSQRSSVVKTEPDNATIPSLDNLETDPAFTRLVSVYEQARTEYLAVADHHGDTTICAAKFLRDTVENVIDNLKDKPIDAQKHAELQTMARMAKDTVVGLCGGKKRKFDHEGARTRNHSPAASNSGVSRSRYPDRASYPYGRRERRADERRYPRDRASSRDRTYGRERSPDRVSIAYGYGRPVDTYYPA